MTAGSLTLPVVQRPTVRVAPPFALPGLHLIAAQVWLTVGAAGLVIVAPDLAAGSFLAPRVIAVTHAFTLGVITTSIFGVLYQILPVALGAPARSLLLGYLTFGVLEAGVALMVVGSWQWRPALFATAWVLLLLAAVSLAWNAVTPALHAPRDRRMARYVGLGTAFLFLAIAVAGARVGEYLGFWRGERFGALTAHVHWAVVGFATLTAVGVGGRMLPMFLKSRDHAQWPLRAVGWVTVPGLLILGAGHLAPSSFLIVAGGGLVVGGMALYLHQLNEYFRNRTTSSLDPALAHVAVARVFLVVAVLFGIVLLHGSGSARLVTAYGVAGMLGWLTLLVIGITYKILPFLTWLHRFGGTRVRAGAPTVRDLTSRPLAWASLMLVTSGVGILTAGVLLGTHVLAYAGAAGFATGVAIICGQYLWMARPTVLRAGHEGARRLAGNTKQEL